MEEEINFLFERIEFGLIDDSLPASMDWVEHLKIEKNLIEKLKEYDLYKYFNFIFKIFKIGNPNPLRLKSILGRQVLYYRDKSFFFLESYNPIVQYVVLFSDESEICCNTIIFCINEKYIEKVNSMLMLIEDNIKVIKHIKLLDNKSIVFDFYPKQQ